MNIVELEIMERDRQKETVEEERRREKRRS